MPVWDPQTKADCNKLGKKLNVLQPDGYFHHIPTKPVSLSNLCQRLQLESLEEGRKIQCLALMYKTDRF